ncbi:MAG: trehalose-phosphatase [Bacteroidia bacterium]
MAKAAWVEKYRNAASKLILLDYDGTLVGFSLLPEKAVPSKRLLAILTKLIDEPKTKVIIISGRSHLDIDKFLGHLPIGIIAEHGAMIKANGEWKKQVIDNGSWKSKVLSVLNGITLLCPNSFIEEKHFSITWHYRNTELESGYFYSRKLINNLVSIISSHNLKILDGNKVVEIMRKEIGKGMAVKNLVKQNKYDYILSIGDDKTDEEIFEFFLYNMNAVTIKVGTGNSFAKYKLSSFNHVISFLEQLSR